MHDSPEELKTANVDGDCFVVVVVAVFAWYLNLESTSSTGFRRF